MTPAPGGWIGLAGQATRETSNVPDVDAGVRPVPLIDDVEDEADVVHAPSLGQMLRAERERRGIGLDTIEHATHIRSAQLRAIEEDRLDALPAEAYARGFVRAYAEELDIDQALVGKLFSEQWEALAQRDVSPYALARPPVASAPRPWRQVGALSMAGAIVLLIASTAIFILTDRGGSSHPRSTPTAARHSGATSTPTPPGSTQTPPPQTPAAPHVVRLTIGATAGTCWFEARVGSPTGRLLGERTLAIGETTRLHGRRIWLRLGAPGSVRVTLNGRPLHLPASAGPINLLLTPHGARPA
jgi:hypothetical protein